MRRAIRAPGQLGPELGALIHAWNQATTCIIKLVAFFAFHSNAPLFLSYRSSSKEEQVVDKTPISGDISLSIDHGSMTQYDGTVDPQCCTTDNYMPW